MIYKNKKIAIDKLLMVAIEASIEAGLAIMEVYEGIDFGIEQKADKSFLTKADKIAHTIIVKHLEKTQIPVLSEEGKEILFDTRKEWNQLWIVDPLDGTKEFINRNGEFTVNIALVKNQIPIIGVIYCPVLKTLYFASETIGSYKIQVDFPFNIESIEENSVKLPTNNTSGTYTVVASRSHLSPETIDFIDTLKLEHGDIEMVSKGSSLKFCLVAEGTAQCYPRFAPTMEWDTAAGHAICKYAGFTVIDFETKKEKSYNNPQLLNNWFLVKRQ